MRRFVLPVVLYALALAAPITVAVLLVRSNGETYPADPVRAFADGTLVDCQSGERLFTPQTTAAAALLDEEDRLLITKRLPFFFYGADAVLFAHRTGGQGRERPLYVYVFLRAEKRGYCALRSVPWADFPFNEALSEKYRRE